MNRFLPDVNTVLALLDPMHVHHEAAHQWCARNAPIRWVTCPHVENGAIRAASQPKYPNWLGSTQRVRDVLQAFIRKVEAESCTAEVSLLDDSILLKPGSLTPSRVSDLYLLALAASSNCRLATFDRRIPAEAVAGGVEALELIPVASEAAD